MIKDKITIHPNAESVTGLLKYIEKEQAAGRVKMLLTVWVDDEGCVNCHHSDLISTSRALGALEMLKHRILQS